MLESAFFMLFKYLKKNQIKPQRPKNKEQRPPPPQIHRLEFVKRTKNILCEISSNLINLREDFLANS